MPEHLCPAGDCLCDDYAAEQGTLIEEGA